MDLTIVVQMATGGSRLTAVQLIYGLMGVPYPLFCGQLVVEIIVN